MNPATNHKSLSAHRCVICGVTLNVHEQTRGKTCARVDCKNEQIRNEATKEARRKHDLEQRALEIEASLLGQRTTDDDEKRLLVVLPSNDRRLVPLDKRSLREFLDRLMTVISQAAAVRYGKAELEEEPSVYDNERPISDDHLATLGHGCAVCRGHCCRQGRGHAFIYVSTVLKYMEQNPTQRPRDVLDAYVSRIGFRAYENSCVYHDANGCRLPREMRSKVCNGYLCEGLTGMLDQLEEDVDCKAVAVSVGDYYPSDSLSPGSTLARPATIDPQSFEVHEELIELADEVSDEPRGDLDQPDADRRESAELRWER